ncbi:MAG TPA: HPr family phosphocarrier protein [Pyrinomonadaceae bacterium]|nr:HPr family phosphocarrier protein [Pyrinomonadaceae bacterium]
MVECEVRVVNRLGLHARAAAKLVRMASGFRSAVRLERCDRAGAADAKSILSVLVLAAARGTELKVTAEGADEGAALDAVRELISSGFGETEE